MTKKQGDLGNGHYQQLNELAAVLVPESIHWVEELKKYREHKGSDERYHQKARLGISVLGHAVRICATIENARSNDLVATRLLQHGPEVGLKAGAAVGKLKA